MASTQTDHTRKRVFSRARARSVSLCVCLFHTPRDAILKLSGRSACVERERKIQTNSTRDSVQFSLRQHKRIAARMSRRWGDDAGRARGRAGGKPITVVSTRDQIAYQSLSPITAHFLQPKNLTSFHHFPKTQRCNLFFYVQNFAKMRKNNNFVAYFPLSFSGEIFTK
jgi:hypothetical protein